VVLALIVTGILYTGFPEQLGGPNIGWRSFTCHLLGQLAALAVWETTAAFTSHRWFATRPPPLVLSGHAASLTPY
jgi:hypothetical protein